MWNLTTVLFFMKLTPIFKLIAILVQVLLDETSSYKPVFICKVWWWYRSCIRTGILWKMLKRYRLKIKSNNSNQWWTNLRNLKQKTFFKISLHLYFNKEDKYLQTARTIIRRKWCDRGYLLSHLWKRWLTECYYFAVF